MVNVYYCMIFSFAISRGNFVLPLKTNSLQLLRNIFFIVYITKKNPKSQPRHQHQYLQLFCTKMSHLCIQKARGHADALQLQPAKTIQRKRLAEFKVNSKAL